MSNREMFEVFAELHPIKAYDLDRKAFYKFMKKKMPALSRKTIDELMTETKTDLNQQLSQLSSPINKPDFFESKLKDKNQDYQDGYNDALERFGLD